MKNNMKMLSRFGVVAVMLAGCALGSNAAGVDAAVLTEYVETMRNGEDPVEYVFRLFEGADIVIIGERDHRDVTQYELITTLLADPRFAERVGYVYTEVGVTNMTQRANELVKDTYQSDEDFRKTLLSYLRDEDYSFCWEKTNRSVFLDSLYCINNRLPASTKITLGLTDPEFDWYETMSPEYYRQWYYDYAMLYPDKTPEEQCVRDRIMAENFSRLYRRQKPIDGSRKALVITNHPHAVNDDYSKNEGYRIKQEFGADNVKIVCLNWYVMSNSSDYPSLLFDEGRWDAAFELIGCRPVAFDIKGNPFGQAIYHNTWRPFSGKSWETFADGIIYYKPFYEFKASIGIEGFVDDNCKEEQMRRLKLIYDAGLSSDFDYESNKEYYNSVRIFSCERAEVLDAMREQMKTNL